MSSQVEILNLAFRDLGAQPIIEYGENSKEGALSTVYWPAILKESLEAHEWDFAKKWTSLAEDADYTFVDTEWTYAYNVPADYIKFSSQVDDANLFVRRGEHFLANVNPFAIEYIWAISDTKKFPSHFDSVMVAKLRTRLQIPLAKKGTKTPDWFQAEQIILANAKLIDAQQTQPSEESQKRLTDATEPWLQVYE